MVVSVTFLACGVLNQMSDRIVAKFRLGKHRVTLDQSVDGESISAFVVGKEWLHGLPLEEKKVSAIHDSHVCFIIAALRFNRVRFT
ncbi:MAG: hypothetical protein ACLVB5_12905 [Christensenellales bacterium]